MKDISLVLKMMLKEKKGYSFLSLLWISSRYYCGLPVCSKRIFNLTSRFCTANLYFDDSCSKCKALGDYIGNKQVWGALFFPSWNVYHFKKISA